jgi:hypothetical protein
MIVTRAADREAAVRFPFAAAAGGTGNHRVAVTGATQSFALPQPMKGKFIYFGVDADGTALTKVQVTSAATAQTVALDATTGITAGITVKDGNFIDRRLGADGATHICWIGDAAAGFVEFYVSEDPVGGA